MKILWYAVLITVEETYTSKYTIVCIIVKCIECHLLK